MKVTIEMACSINGIIATENGNEDFLSDRNYEIMLEILKDYDCLVWGNTTFKNVISWGENYINDLKNILVIVFSKEEQISNFKNVIYVKSLEEFLNISKMKKLNKVLVSGGAHINTLFMKNNLVNSIIINYNPYVLNKGINLFAGDSFEHKLSLDKVVNEIIITVTAENKEYKVYKIKAIKNMSDNNYLSSLKVMNGTNELTLNPEFDKTKNEYHVLVDGSVTNVDIVAVLEEQVSTITGVGKHYIATGDNEIEINVTSESGQVRTYKIIVTKELNDDLKIVREDTDLSDWAKQGVFLLNTVLTVEKDKANSHKDIGWEIFTDYVIKQINDKLDNVVFILWGRQARDKKRMITNPNHYVIESAHPSPLSAYNGFFGSKPFSKANEYLKKNTKKEINW